MLSVGVTSAQDAWLDEKTRGVYEYLAANDLLKVRMTVNPFLNQEKFRNTKGIDTDAMMAYVQEVREQFEPYPMIKADAAKIMVDGVIEYPTQTAAMMEPYKQPVISDHQVSFYVDQDSPLCIETRQHIKSYDQEDNARTFVVRNGFEPLQCVKNYGRLMFSQEELNRMLTLLDKEDFVAHMHVIGDQAAHNALNAVEQLPQKADGEAILHSLAHVQIVHPDDKARFGQLNVSVIPTYVWIAPAWEYDLTINPYMDELQDLTDLDALYGEGTYWNETVYPFRSIRDAGGVLAAGSDAPVDDRSPRPFANIEKGMTRGEWVPKDPTVPEGQVADEDWTYQVMNMAERLALDDLIAAYTINGAKTLRQDDITGSLEVGKRADMIVIDQNLLNLVAADEYEKIGQTKVLATLVDGHVVYQAE